MKKILLFPIFLLLGILGCSKEKEITIDYYNLIVNTRWVNLSNNIHTLLYFHSDSTLNITTLDTTMTRDVYSWYITKDILYLTKDSNIIYRLRMIIEKDNLILNCLDEYWSYPLVYRRSYLK